MGRVVAEMDMVKSGFRSRRAREMVDLPAPDGEDNTNINPRRLIPVFLTLFFSLNVLNLLTHLVDCGFQGQSNPSQLDIGGF